MFSKFAIALASFAMVANVGVAIGVTVSKQAEEVNAAVVHAFVPFTGDYMGEANNYIIYSGSNTLGNDNAKSSTGFASYRTSFNSNVSRFTGASTSEIHRIIPTGSGSFNIYNAANEKYIGVLTTKYGMTTYDSGTDDATRWIIRRRQDQNYNYYYEFENVYKMNSSNAEFRANSFLTNTISDNLWWMGGVDDGSNPIKLFIETPIHHVAASAVNANKLIGNKLSASDFDVKVYWNSTEYTAVTSDFTWTVNGVKNGEISLGENTVVVTYNGVQSNEVSFFGEELHAESVTLNKTMVTLYTLNSAYQLTATIVPANTTDTVEWTSLNPEVATVSQTGLVTPVSAGVATIKVRVGYVSAQCTVTVYDYQAIEFNFKNGSAYNIPSSQSGLTQATINGYVFNFLNVHNNGGSNSVGAILKYSGGNVLSNHTAIPGAIARITYTMYVSATPYSLAKFRALCSNNEINTHIQSGNGTSFDACSEYSINYDVANNYHFFGITDAPNYNGQILKIKVYYAPTTIKEDIRALATQTQLSYRYTKEGNTFTYTDLSIRFGAVISKDLWNELDTIYGITGFGVMISSGDYVRDYHDFDDFAAAAIEPGENVYTDINNNVVNYFVPIADMNETIGVDGDNYFWNLRWSVDQADMDKVFSAAPYIKVGDEYVFLKKEITCVTFVAYDYILNRGYSAETAGGSLQNIVDQSQFE